MLIFIWISPTGHLSTWYEDFHTNIKIYLCLDGYILLDKDQTIIVQMNSKIMMTETEDLYQDLYRQRPKIYVYQDLYIDKDWISRSRSVSCRQPGSTLLFVGAVSTIRKVDKHLGPGLIQLLQQIQKEESNLETSAFQIDLLRHL